MEQEEKQESTSPLPVIPRLDRIDRLVTYYLFYPLIIIVCYLTISVSCIIWLRIGVVFLTAKLWLCSCSFWKRSIARRESKIPPVLPSDKACQKIRSSRLCPLRLRKFITKAHLWSEWQCLRIEFYRHAFN